MTTSSKSRVSLLATRKKKKKKSINLTFGDLEYRNNNGMVTTIWGPAMWHFLHTMSFNYPVEPTPFQKHMYMKFVKSLVHVLPCGKCRKNLRTNFQKKPLRMEDMKSRETFSKYIFELHEVVNNMLEKPSGLSYEQVRDTYEHFRARCHTSSSSSSSEKGCTEPVYKGKKPQCILQIVPKSCSLAKSRRHLRISNECLKQKKM